MITNSAQFLKKRVDDIKQQVILNECKDIDFDDHNDLYSRIINSFSLGTLDSVYSSPFLNNLDPEKKNELLSLGRKYFDLCFPYGDKKNWSQYVDSYFGDNLDLFLIVLLSNYDILLEILHYGGESCLELLRDFGMIGMYDDMSALDYFKTQISDIDVLKQVLIELGQNDNLYSKFSFKQKSLLATYPVGNLCEKKEDGSFETVSPNMLGLKIVKKVNKDASIDTFDFNKFLKLISDNNFFVDAVTDNYLEGNFGSLDDDTLGVKK